MRRINAILSLLVNQIHILETMSPFEFLGFRSRLNPASGFQSTQFREIEITGGIREPQILEHFKDEGDVFSELLRRTNQPSLCDVFYQLLRRHGFKLPIPEGLASEPEQEELNAEETCQQSRLQELRRLYEETDKYYDLHELAETLVDFDEHLYFWRAHHATVVERIIGFKRGTGKSEGVPYLRSTLNKRCFPDLWKVRTAIEFRQTNS
jgi:tryptophan 2,3-dioxygenase